MTKKRNVLTKTTALIVDGAYARIQGRKLGGNIDFAKLRTELEEINSAEFEECWYFDSQRSDARGNSALASEFHALKYARPHGPQFHVQVFSTKPYNCHCTKCGHNFIQNVQKGVDNGIATKLLTLTLSNRIERVILFSGDGDFYTSLRHVRCELGREVWVVGYWGTVSGDLQQLASRMVWVNDLWGRVKLQGRRAYRGRGTPSRKRNGRADTHHGARRRLDINHWVVSPHCDGEVASLDEHPLYDEVNLSGSDDEEDKWFPPLVSPANVSRSSEPEQRLKFPLPMAIPVATLSTTSTERADHSWA